MLQQKKVDYWFFYNENGSKRRGHLLKKKIEWLSGKGEISKKS
jgi:hypothetical protein